MMKSTKSRRVTTKHSRSSHLRTSPTSTTSKSTLSHLHSPSRLTSSRSPRIQTQQTSSMRRVSHHANVLSKCSSTTMSRRSVSHSFSDSMAEPLRLHTKDNLTLPNFDYVVIGGGSGGIASARRAASYGAKVAVVEKANLGGTCVNVGCIPKKLMFNASSIATAMRDSKDYGFDQDFSLDNTNFNWSRFVAKRDTYITRLNGIYYRNLLRDNIYLFRGAAEFEKGADGSIDMSTLVIKKSDTKYDDSDAHVKDVNLDELKGREIIVDDDHPVTVKIQRDVEMASYTGSKVNPTPSSTPNTVEANSILISSGGFPSPLGVPGEEHSINSDGFFALKNQPRRAFVVGSGYIAVELSQVLAALGTPTTIAIRGDTVLRSFDHSISEVLTKELEKEMDVKKCTMLKRIVPLPDGHTKLDGERDMNEQERAALFTKRPGDDNVEPHQILGVYVSCNRGCSENNIKPGEEFLLGYFDTVLGAIGRKPSSHLLNVPVSRDETDIINKRTGCILIDDIGEVVQTPSTKNLFAVGDVVDNGPDLTPIAIQFGRRLSDWLFGGKPKNPLYFETSRTVDPEDSSIMFTQVPTVVFSHPPIGTAGYTEAQAEQKYGKENIRVHHSKFNPLYGALLPEEHKSPSVTKIICSLEENKHTGEKEEIVVGIHVLSHGADEMIQGFGIAVANRLPKSYIDNTIAIHPTVSEELVLFR